MKSDEIVLTSRIRLARNISKELFPHKISIEKGRDLVNKIEDVFYCKDEYDKDFKTIYLWNTDKLAQKSYFERHLISSNMINNSVKSAFIYNNAETISLMINEEDHIRIQCINSGYDLDKSLVIANEIDDFLEENIDFAFHERYGYLTACPTNIGTALRASVMIHLPVITLNHKLEGVVAALSQIGMTIRGLYGEGSKAYGNLYQISNQITLGISEEEAVNNLKTVVNQIINQESSAREEVYKNYRYEVEDRVSRSLGILRSAVLLSTSECLKLLSDLRLGCEMDIIKDIDIRTVNSLFIDTQPATIQRKLGKSLAVKEINLARAALIKEKL
ncbi:MAG: protein arginine kinase [Solirubrobacterales bacterium]